jgi:diadenosine tetraphosphate (Ap4A) HIT family hydrolase
LEPCPFCSVPTARIWIETEHAIAFGDEPIRGLVADVRERLLTGMKPDGFNIGFNDGCLVACQTVVHAHLHVIPRRDGDVPDPRGGIRWVIAENAPYWKK